MRLTLFFLFSIHLSLVSARADGPFKKVLGFPFYCLATLHAAGMNYVNPWRRLEVSKTRAIWSPEQQAVVWEKANAFNREFVGTAFGPTELSFQWLDPRRKQFGMPGEDTREKGTKYSLEDQDFEKLRKEFGLEIAEPLVKFIQDRLSEPAIRDFPYRRVEVNIRTEENIQGFFSGHNHGFGRSVQWLRAEHGPSTLYRPDGLSLYQNAATLTSVEEGNTIRFNYTFHAEPHLKEGEKRLIVMLSVHDR